MTRYEFLKSMGFKGAALMALMTSCIREEDMYINALTEKAIASTPVTPTPPVTTTPGTVEVNLMADDNSLLLQLLPLQQHREQVPVQQQGMERI